MRTVLAKEIKEAVARSYLAGTPCGEVAKEFGLTPPHVMMIAMRYDRDRYLTRRQPRQALPKEQTAKRADGVRRQESVLWIEHDAARLAQFIPEDTRSLTGRFCGDPLPGRSALDLRLAR